MERATKGALGTSFAAIVVGVGYWIDLFYRSTVLADPTWPRSIQNTSLLFSLIAAVVVSVACSGASKERLKRYLKWSTFSAIAFLIFSLAAYWTLHKPLVNGHSAMEAVDDLWVFIDFIAMISVILIVSFASLIAGSSLWESFSGSHVPNNGGSP
jgi:hypothetical protein